MIPTFMQTTGGYPAHPVTIRKQATAEEIHADLQERLERMIARDPKFRGCEAPMPKPIERRGIDAPNWTVDGFPMLASGCFTALVQLVDQARLEYDLID